MAGNRTRALGMLVVLTGVLVAAVDGTIVVLALPAIQQDLGGSLASVTWVVIGYLLVVTVLATQLGRLGDLFGRVRMYRAGFAVFVAGWTRPACSRWAWACSACRGR
ncbi:MFS transporter [Amycolatopsis sp. cmx-4-68]|uniref:MFS transporter n=1 Tax=Amycolatopsis sp. cmx-4-68 TaxID=2790938 RepID=UPI00397B1FE1